MSILVSGGAGYIGAQVVRVLQERGERVVVADDLSYGKASRIGGAKLVQLDVADDASRTTLANVMVDEDVSAVIHFAARKQVGESGERPAWYYQQNVGGLANMLMSMGETGVDRMIFSSSAAVYGMPPVDVVTEDVEKHPINPYGETKLIGEWMMADCERAWNLNWIGLRYFNVAGTVSDDLEDPATLNLVPMILDRLAKGESAKIFGTDYPTPDGTCIRDYVHVTDLADAHLRVLERLETGSLRFNVGNGTGYSVKQVMDSVERISGRPVPHTLGPRRAGDPAVLVASSARLREETGWSPRFGALDDIVRSAWAWHSAHPRGYADRG